MSPPKEFPEGPLRSSRQEISEAPGPSFKIPLWTERSNDPDSHIRTAAFDALHRQVAIHGPILPWEIIESGFLFNHKKIYFASRAEGIFSPRQMTTLLSIKTVLPRKGRHVWYRDQSVSLELTREGQALRYDFRGSDPNSRQNRLLHQAMELKIPIIYLFGVAPGLYEAVFPVFVTAWHPDQLSVEIEVSLPDAHDEPLALPTSIEERRYAARSVRQRLHQSMFRSRVLAAYEWRCAISRLPVARLIDAAHIVADNDRELGQPDIRNGICLSRLHHAAFDNNLIGIDADFRIHAARALLEVNDGPLLNQLKQVHGSSLIRPKEVACWPDRARLAVRFENFMKMQPDSPLNHPG